MSIGEALVLFLGGAIASVAFCWLFKTIDEWTRRRK